MTITVPDDGRPASDDCTPTTISLSYVLPLRRLRYERSQIDELSAYLATLDGCDVIVADGSPADVFEEHARLTLPHVRHVRVPETPTMLNGKVAGVLAGVAHARYADVIIADDDVRYDRAALARMREELGRADVVRPQNYFAPLPWHAALDTARTLLNRALDGDWPGTLGVRAEVLARTGGYDGDVLFENLELVRTVRATGGRERVARDVFVRRMPPATAHFLRQRVRQAYDEFARPVRLAVMLALLPAGVMLARARRWRELAASCAATIVIAEFGRRRDGGARVFPALASLLAPAWILERAVCAWLAVGLRVFGGGVSYSHGKLRRAATPLRVLRQRFA